MKRVTYTGTGYYSGRGFIDRPKRSHHGKGYNTLITWVILLPILAVILYATFGG
jgi:hypothetical protein